MASRAIADQTVGRAAWGWILAANALGTMLASAFLAKRKSNLAANTGVVVVAVAAMSGPVRAVQP